MLAPAHTIHIIIIKSLLSASTYLYDALESIKRKRKTKWSEIKFLSNGKYKWIAKQKFNVQKSVFFQISEAATKAVLKKAAF